MALPVSWRLREYWNSQKLSQRLKIFYANLRLFFIFLAEAQRKLPSAKLPEQPNSFIRTKSSRFYCRDFKAVLQRLDNPFGIG